MSLAIPYPSWTFLGVSTGRIMGQAEPSLGVQRLPTDLLAASSLAIGTAWDLITHPTTGGTGSGVVVNDGIAMTLANTPVSIVLDQRVVSVLVATDPMIVAVASDPVSLVLSPPTISTKASS